MGMPEIELHVNVTDLRADEIAFLVRLLQGRGLKVAMPRRSIGKFVGDAIEHEFKLHLPSEL